jgi:hypothetical protein
MPKGSAREKRWMVGESRAREAGETDSGLSHIDGVTGWREGQNDTAGVEVGFRLTEEGYGWNNLLWSGRGVVWKCCPNGKAMYTRGKNR